jgi:CheY-like chemotaxis protein
VLIVDDELSNRRLAARMLQRLQVESVTLEDGDEVGLW